MESLDLKVIDAFVGNITVENSPEHVAYELWNFIKNIRVAF